MKSFPHMRGGVSISQFPNFKTSGLMCFPHMRGGVSRHSRAARASSLFSPHAWGCFRPRVSNRQRDFVFPTCVGVFLPFQYLKPLLATEIK